MLKPFLFLWSLVLAPITATHAGACDQTMIDGVASPADADSIVVNDPGSQGIYREGFDYAHGRFFGSGWRVHDSRVIDESGSDIYRIDGTPSGIPIPVHVEFIVVFDGGGPFPNPDSVYCSSCGNESFSLSASISDGRQSPSFSMCTQGCPVTRTLGLDIVVMPGQDFQIWYQVRGQFQLDHHSGDVEAWIRMDGLPGSAVLTSCHGVMMGAVPTQQRTWGRLKASYR